MPPTRDVEVPAGPDGVAELLREAAPARPCRALSSVLLMTTFSCGLLVAGLVGATKLPVSSNISHEAGAGIALTPHATSMSFPAMAPGTMVTRPVTVRNEGSGVVRYAVRGTTSTGPLAEHLVLSIRRDVRSCTNVGFSRSGTVLYQAGRLGSPGGMDLVGSAAEGQDPGDAVIEPGATHALCFQVWLPAAYGGSGRQSAAVSFALDAEEVVG